MVPLTLSITELSAELSWHECSVSFAVLSVSDVRYCVSLKDELGASLSAS
jgi:hypothetical protein